MKNNKARKNQKTNDPHNSQEDILSSDLASSILKTINDAVIITDVDGKILFWNHGATLTYGYKQDEVLGKNISLIYEKKDKPKLKVKIESVVSGNNLSNTEVHPITKDGKKLIVLLSLKGLVNTEGNVHQLLGYAKDITEKVRTKDELSELENIHVSAISTLEEGFVIHDLSDKLLTANQAAADILGLTMNQLIGKSARDSRWKALHEDSSPFNPEEFPSVYTGKTGKPLKDVIMNIHSGKEMRKWISINSKPVFGENNKQTATVVTFQDITERKNAENKLKESEENFSEMFRRMNDGVCRYRVVDNGKDFIFVDINKAGERIARLKRSSILGKSIFEIRPQSKEYGLTDAFKKVYKTGIPENYGEFFYQDKNLAGYFKNFVYKLSSGDIVAIFQDLTEEKLAEQELIQAKEKAEISKNNLNSIINSILDPVFVKDENSKLILVNDAFCKIFELKRDAIIGKTLAGEVSEDERKKFLKIDQQVLDTGKDNIIEETLTLKNKQERIISTKKSRFIGSDNRKYIVGVIQDITESKKINADLSKSEKLLNASQRIGKLGGWELDLITGNLYWTAETYRIHETEPEAFNPTVVTHVSYFLPESQQTITKALVAAIEKGEGYDFELESYTAKGNLIHVRTTCEVTLVHGKSVKLTGIFQDITERKLAEEDLKKAFNKIDSLKQELEAENLYLKEELKLEGKFEEIIGSSTALSKTLKQVEKVAKTDSIVLILGETGTGKELIAKAVHDASDRKNKPLIKVNCTALPSELIESELFGHEKGAFTGAVNRKIGRFELAHGGTIFLDEIGDLPLSLQTRLLRVLQENEFERVGGEKTIKIDVRVITATNRNLEERVVEGEFRQDLYYRLNVFPIICPPLRDRINDVPDLVNHFVNKYNRKVGGNIKSVNKSVIKKLMDYQWPGNIRELEHVIERAVIMNVGSQLRLGDWFKGKNSEIEVSEKLSTLEDIERNYIKHILKETNGKIRGNNGASEILGLKPTTLESRMKKLNISKNK